MVLLSLLAVGLLSLSSITLRASGQSQAREVAKNNARLALMLAIGDLQKAAGPDQKITATANIAASSSGQELAPGGQPANDRGLDGTSRNLSGVQSGTRHWTGVFVNQDDPDEIFEKTPTAAAEHWLVSGFSRQGDGTMTVTPASADCAVSADGGVANPDQAVVLVGPSSALDGTADDFVAAPLVKVNSDGEDQADGAYAFWIGDEGVKSRLNLERQDEDWNSYASLTPQRRGWETVEGFDDYAIPTGDEDRILPSLITMPTGVFVSQGFRRNRGAGESSVFHSATTDSMGVVSNTLDGGLRVDLSAAFGGDLPARAPNGAYDNYPTSGGRVVPEGALRTSRRDPPKLELLKWDHLVDFVRQGSQTSENVLLVSERSGADEIAIAPTISDFRLLFGVRLEEIRSGRNTTGRYKVFPCGKFAVSLANPYAQPLEWDKDIEIEVKNMTPAGNAPSRIWQFGGNAVYIPRGGSMDSPGTERAVFNQAVFRIRPGRLEPGEAKAYTMASRVVRPFNQATQRVTIDMVPFVSAVPFDFNRCIELEGPAETTMPKGMDVRESWQTTLVGLEMRLASRGSGSGRWLRRLEGFELDNGYFGPNTRRFDKNNASRLRGPVPLMLYSFQISQPGMRYDTLMPRGYELGQRSSTLRTYADFNVRAANIHKAIASYNPPPYFMESNDSISLLPFEPGGQTGTGFTRNLVAEPLFWGHASESGSDRVVLFTHPADFSSLAQFQHADLTVDNVTRSVGHQPGNAFGNSYASPFVQRQLVQEERTDYVLKGSPDRSGTFKTERYYFDISHILNSSLWDRYFFSSIPYGSTAPENEAIIVDPAVTAGDLSDPSTATARMMIDGAFNVNCTDKNAWKALFASSKYFSHPADGREEPEATFPRSLEQLDAFDIPATGERNDSFSGYRRLTDEELDALATEMVRQVRLRGPFVSLSHFVNRALSPINRNPELSRSGALQQALDESGINIDHDGRKNGFNGLNATQERVTLPSKQGAPRADLDGGDLGGRPESVNPRHPDWAVTSRDNNFGSVASILADQEMLHTGGSGRGSQTSREQGYRSTGIPGWVTQADVLQAIGPVISARSDTFRIRTCGQAYDAAGNITATAYCEAVVQRQPDYVDAANAPHDRGATLNPINQKYGRRFELVSFRWLSAQEV